MIKAKLHRPGYKKFKVEDLGINIIGNPNSSGAGKKKAKKPKEYTIMEMNPTTYTHDSRRTSGTHRQSKNDILVFTQNISGYPYLCFSDGHTDSCIKMTYQIALSIKERMIRKSGAHVNEAHEKIASGGFVMHISKDDMAQIQRDAEKYGFNLERERDIHKQNMQVENRMSAKDGIHMRYLISACM